ncbi:MAG TPA: hypothetical protein PLV96_11160 [Methanoregulaceae archaeon]|nr:hypothetical protein [Methanoregulaceae archaeon]HQA81342.1 hypothetical protein [Methanoregulaceae archaeon]
MVRGGLVDHARHAEGEGRFPRLSRHPGAYTSTGLLNKGWVQVGTVVASG